MKKQWTNKEVKRKIKEVISSVHLQDLNGKTFSLSALIGGYQFNSMNRIIKEKLFKNIGDKFEIKSRNGTWVLRYPNKSVKKMINKVIKK